MGYADGTAKEYTRQNDIFADTFNFYLYGGAQTIKPEQLRELDTAELSILPDAEDPALLALVPDYPVHLLSPYELTEDENEKFHTSLGDVLTFIKYSKDKEKMLNWLEGAGADVQFGRREVDVLNGCVNAKLSMRQDKEAVNVCEAIRQMIEEATEDAVREVKAEAENAVREAKAEAENALKENTISSIRNLMANLHLTAEQAISALGIPEADGKVFLKNL